MIPQQYFEGMEPDWQRFFPNTEKQGEYRTCREFFRGSALYTLEHPNPDDLVNRCREPATLCAVYLASHFDGKRDAIDEERQAERSNLLFASGPYHLTALVMHAVIAPEDLPDLVINNAGTPQDSVLASLYKAAQGIALPSEYFTEDGQRGKETKDLWHRIKPHFKELLGFGSTGSNPTHLTRL